jgi:putative hydrolase of the HAD superfamily
LIRAIVFDLDDTLYPERQFVLSGFREVGDWISRTHGIAGFYERATRLFNDGRRGNIFDVALDELGVVHAKEFIRQMVAIYRDHKASLALYEDAQWAISNFKKDKKLGVLTDGFLVTQRNKVAALGIEPHFDTIIYSDEFGREHWKPSERPYIRIMEVLQCAGKECVYVADNPAKDFVAAKALGWQTIQIRRKDGEYAEIHPSASHAADSVIHSLFHLERLIE